MSATVCMSVCLWYNLTWAKSVRSLVIEYKHLSIVWASSHQSITASNTNFCWYLVGNYYLTYFDPLFIINTTNHLHTCISQLREIWMLVTKIPENFDDSFSYTYTSVLKFYETNIFLSIKYNKYDYCLNDSSYSEICSLLSIKYRLMVLSTAVEDKYPVKLMLTILNIFTS